MMTKALWKNYLENCNFETGLFENQYDYLFVIILITPLVIFLDIVFLPTEIMTLLIGFIIKNKSKGKKKNGNCKNK